MLKELDAVKDVGFTREGKIKSFYKLLRAEESRKSLLPSKADLNGSFRLLNSSNQPKRIAIPNFDGDVLNFHNFRGLFENFVHNNSELSNVEKLYYLKQALTEPAKQIISDFELEDTSYPEAWL